MAILKSKSFDDAIVIITDYLSKNKSRIVMAIHFDKRGEKYPVNVIVSAYKNSHVKSLFGDNREYLLYTRNNESIDKLLQSGLQLPGTANINASNNNINQTIHNNNPQNNIKYSITEPQTLSDYLSEENAPKRKIKEQFSIDEPIEETKDLIAVHNLSEENLLKILKQDGKMPMPSIAITRTELGHEGYGDISLIFPSEIIDPQKNKANNIYSRDIWSATYPKLEVYVSPNDQLKFKHNVYNPLTEKYGNELTEAIHELSYNAENAINREDEGIDDLKYKLRNDENLKRIFLAENGNQQAVEKSTTEKRTQIPQNQIDFYNKTNEIIPKEEYIADNEKVDYLYKYAIKQHMNELLQLYNENPIYTPRYENLIPRYIERYLMEVFNSENGYIIEKNEEYKLNQNEINKLINKEEFSKWIDKITKNLITKVGLRNNKEEFTKNGNRRSWDNLHVENTPENAMQIMNERDLKSINNSAFQSPINKLIVNSSYKYNNLDEIRADKGLIKLQDENEIKKQTEKLNDKLYDLAKSLKGKNTDIHVRANALAEAVYYRKTENGYINYVKKYNIIMTPQHAKQLNKLKEETNKLAKKYAEAKPNKIVNAKESAFAVYSDKTKPEVKKALDDNNIINAEYNSNIEGDRKRVINDLAKKYNVVFSVADDTQADLNAPEEIIIEPAGVKNNQNNQRADETLNDKINPQTSEENANHGKTEQNENQKSAYENTMDMLKDEAYQSVKDQRNRELLEKYQKANDKNYNKYTEPFVFQTVQTDNGEKKIQLTSRYMNQIHKNDTGDAAELLTKIEEVLKDPDKQYLGFIDQAYEEYIPNNPKRVIYEKNIDGKDIVVEV